MTWIFGVLFFLSGTAALVFENLWFHQAGLAFGNGIWASSIVLASFMAGLALGNALAARLGHRIGRPIQAYAMLEVVVGASGVVLVWMLPSLAPGLAPLMGSLLDVPWALNGLRLLLGFTLLLLPATAMGATLPLMVKGLCRFDPRFGSVLGKLYGWNTLGAVAGALLGELVFLERFGVHGSAFLAAGLDALAATGALALSQHLATMRPRAAARSSSPPPVSAPTTDASPNTVVPPLPGPMASHRAMARRILGAAALAGGVLLGLEVVWFRFLSLFVHAGDLTFAVMLAVVLAGISLGGFAAGQWLRSREQAHRHAGSVALIAGGFVVLLYGLFTYALGPYGTDYVYATTDILWLGTLLMFPGSFLSGLLFTLTGTALRQFVGPETRAVGLLTLANTLGAMAGALVAGFIALPLLGMERSFFAAALLYGLVAVLLSPWRRFAARHLVRRWLLPTSYVGALLLFPFGLMQGHYFQIPVRRWDPDEVMQVVEIREGRGETITYLRKDYAGEPEYYKMLTNSYSMSGTTPGSRRYMKLYVYMPVALHQAPRKALLISYGVGSTAKALTDMEELRQIDIVDISREILEMSDLVYGDSPEHPLRDPRVQVHVEDGRYFLQTSSSHYDIITGEPPPPKVAGVVDLYTREYFRLVHDRLAPGGIHTYWLPVHNLTPADTRAILRAYCDVFDDCSLWVGWNLEWMLMGSNGGIAPVSEETFARQWHMPQVAPELEALGFERPEQLGALFLADARMLREYIAGMPPLTDAFPKRLTHEMITPDEAQLEYGPWMHVETVRQRFEQSEAVRRMWPAGLRQRTLSFFAPQRLLNEISVRPGPRGTPSRFFDDLHRLLTETPLRTLVLWHLGSSVDILPVIDRHLAAGGDPAPYRRVLAFRALASRDYEAATEHLQAAYLASPQDRFLEQCYFYTLCMGGRGEEARGLAEASMARRGTDDGDRSFWLWAQNTFEVAPPPLSR